MEVVCLVHSPDSAAQLRHHLPAGRGTKWRRRALDRRHTLPQTTQLSPLQHQARMPVQATQQLPTHRPCSTEAVGVDDELALSQLWLAQQVVLTPSDNLCNLLVAAVPLCCQAGGFVGHLEHHLV